MDRRDSMMTGAEICADKIGVRKLARRILSGMFFLICGYFAGLAELPFGARPFGVALLSASRKETVFVYSGLVISTFTTFDGDEAIIYFSVYSALMLLRIFSRVIVELRVADGARIGTRRILSALFCEKIGLRVVTSALFGVALGTSMLFSGGLLYYDLFGLLIVSLLSPLSTLLICSYIERRGEKERSFKSESLYLLGFLGLCAIVSFGARELNLYGVSISILFSLFLTFFATCRYGVGYGAMGGLVLGICYSPILSPIFVFSALCMGILSRFSIALACFTAFFTSCAWAFYVLGISALVGVFGGILSACLIYSVVYKMLFSKTVENAKDKSIDSSASPILKCRVLSDSALDGVKLYEMNGKTAAISDGLYRLSLFFEELKSQGKVAYGDKYCAENYNNAFSDDMSVPEYKALSSLLSKAVENEPNDYFIDKELSLRLCQTLTKLKLDIFGVVVYGVRKKTIFIKGRNREILEENSGVIVEALAPLIPFAVNIEQIEVRRDGERGGALFLFEREKNSASVVRRRVIAKGEEVCGDSVAVFKNKDNRFFAFLSDGMGSGSVASAVSGITMGFLGNMLSAGKLSEELIEMLNVFLSSRIQKNASECSATLDLLELDLMNGRTMIYKCGAAPSYIYRKGRLFKLRSDSMPIGILNDVDIKKYELDLSHGDVIVMVSDGVTGEGEECPWLFDLLAQNLPNRSLERTADLIVKYANAKGSGDDITVLLVRVE